MHTVVLVYVKQFGAQSVEEVRFESNLLPLVQVLAPHVGESRVVLVASRSPRPELVDVVTGALHDCGWSTLSSGSMPQMAILWTTLINSLPASVSWVHAKE